MSTTSNGSTKDGIIGAIAVILICVVFFGSCGSCGSSGGYSGKRCTICGKTTGLRHIANSAGDNSWYCEEHYADAWQYYYGK